MSTVSGFSSSADASYATQLARTSSLRRTLNSLGIAVQSGNLDAAASTLSSVIKANPHYSSSSGDATKAQDPINQDFQALSRAIQQKDAEAAKNAWLQLKKHLSQNNVTVGDGTAETATLLANNRASMKQAILDNAFKSAAQSDGMLSALIASRTSGEAASNLNSLVSDWVTYQAGGDASKTSPAINAVTALNKTA